MQDAAAVSSIAEACERAVILAARGGLDVVGSASIALAFADSGDVTVTVQSADGASDAGVVKAADLASFADPDDVQRDSVPPPPPAAG